MHDLTRTKTALRSLYRIAMIMGGGDRDVRAALEHRIEDALREAGFPATPPNPDDDHDVDVAIHYDRLRREIREAEAEGKEDLLPWA